MTPKSFPRWFVGEIEDDLPDIWRMDSETEGEFYFCGDRKNAVKSIYPISYLLTISYVRELTQQEAEEILSRKDKQ